MIVYRIQKPRYRDPLSVAGAARNPGRWHLETHPIVYTAESAALATLEMEAHFQNQLALLKWLLWRIDVDDAHVLTPADAPTVGIGSAQSRETRAYGCAWVDSNMSVALRVPSAVAPHSFNVLINPAHPDYAAAVAINDSEPLEVDSRKWGAT